MYSSCSFEPRDSTSGSLNSPWVNHFLRVAATDSSGSCSSSNSVFNTIGMCGSPSMLRLCVLGNWVISRCTGPISDSYSPCSSGTSLPNSLTFPPRTLSPRTLQLVEFVYTLCLSDCLGNNMITESVILTLCSWALNCNTCIKKACGLTSLPKWMIGGNFGYESTANEYKESILSNTLWIIDLKDSVLTFKHLNCSNQLDGTLLLAMDSTKLLPCSRWRSSASPTSDILASFSWSLMNVISDARMFHSLATRYLLPLLRMLCS